VVNLREPDAKRLYEEAVRRDSGFAMAHFELSLLLSLTSYSLNSPWRSYARAGRRPPPARPFRGRG
jgi:hypothetical protein